jgi:16S rRNA G966 N2-methylase RsmD
VAVDHQKGQVREAWECPGCVALLSKTTKKGGGALRAERTFETYYDRILGISIKRARQTPVVINYSIGTKRFSKRPDDEDLALIQRIAESDIPYWFPINRMPDGDESRRNDDIGITHVHHFHSKRNLWVLATFWNYIKSANGSPLLDFLFTSTFPWTTRQNRLLMTNYFHKSGGVIAPNLPGTLYISSVGIETNPIARFILRAKSIKYTASGKNFLISTQSATRLDSFPQNSADYLFVDPPFGGNLMYSELNFLSESWIRVFTNNQGEAIINKTQRKALNEYLGLMEMSFGQMFTILKPGRWITVEFHNSQNMVWNSIQEAIMRAGFMVADVRILEKTHKTFKQVTTLNAVKKDLAITAYKPRSAFARKFLAEGGSVQGAWTFISQHLEQLPIPSVQNGVVETLAERQNCLLYDRMVAFHIVRGLAVPLSSTEFYQGLNQRYLERDSMYFTPEKAAEYDKRRLGAQQVEQLSLFVTDEKSAVQWLRLEVSPTTGTGPQTYQDLQPKFLRELHQARYEALPELRVMLEDNFLQDKNGFWYIPNPERQADLEALRQRSLLREFNEYLKSKGRLKVFRTEAVRAGFSHYWKERDYDTILNVADRMPSNVLEEDQQLLMYVHNASLRQSHQPKQERLL